MNLKKKLLRKKKRIYAIVRKINGHPIDLQQTEYDRDAQRKECDQIESNVEFKEVVDQNQVVMNSVVFGHQSGQLLIVDPFRHLRPTHLFHTPSDAGEPLGEKSHAGHVEQI